MLLDVSVVSELVAAQFPDLAGCAIGRLGAGWDHELFTAGEWIVRFPKRAARVPWLLREIQITTVVAETVGTRVPRFERVGSPSSRYPYPFVAYRRLEGVAADQAFRPRPGATTDGGDLAELAEDIGRVLSQLHRIDPGRIPPAPARWEAESWGRLRADLVSVAAIVRPLLPPGLLSVAEPYLAGRVPEPARDGPRRLIHNDICPDHLLVDERTGRLAGLIDFTDAMVGEVVLDFVGLIGIGGYPFIEDAAARYGLPLGSGFTAKLVWLCRTLALTWLADAAIDNPAGLGKHLAWVARAFDC